MRFPDDTTEVDYDRLARRGEIAQLNAEDAEDAAHEEHDPQVDAERLDCDLCRDDVSLAEAKREDAFYGIFGYPDDWAEVTA
jgi:hypothetical protein